MYLFYCSGHKNILALHKNTIEFTKHNELSKRGDCIVGVNADFDYGELAKFAESNKDEKIKCRIIADEIQDEFTFFFNPGFSDRHEIVIRRGNFSSERTLGINADKSAKDIKREFIEKIKNSDVRFKVVLNVIAL